jgi:Uncharacterized protein conserved in bacteria (DUF2330)
MNRSSLILFALTVPLLVLSSLTPQSAQACGGFFCDNGPTVMPVDQTGETIVFWVDESGSEPHTEAHIQIQYEGEAENFAWIIPVTSVPEVLVGSQQLFDNLLQATVPSFTVNTQSFGDCSGSAGCLFAKNDRGVEAVALGSSGADGGSEGDTGDGGPEILDRGFAGAFEYVTLTGDSVQEIVDWLDMAGYAQDPDAPPILEEYLQEGFAFVAVKLQAGAEVDEIHPLAIRYAGTEPCIPIRLTRIAAVDDMAIRALFLGEQRLAPMNWPHVVINHSRLDWVNGPALSYPGLVGAAIDEAGGRGFVTEYAGTSAIVSTSLLSEPTWNAGAFEGIEPVDVVDELGSQGLLDCAGGSCAGRHAQVEPLLRTYLPTPDGVEDHEFWSCLSCFVDQIDPVAWSAQPGFAAEFAERITEPGQHAIDILGDSSQLTRMYTLLSPHEMIEDPTFHVTDALSTVDNNIAATRFNDCEGGPSYFELPDGSTVALTDAGTMPNLDGNPAALRIERIPMMGPAQIEVDNAAKIDGLLDGWNDGQLDGPGPGCTIEGLGARELFAMLGIFGIAWFNRRRRG